MAMNARRRGGAGTTLPRTARPSIGRPLDRQLRAGGPPRPQTAANISSLICAPRQPAPGRHVGGEGLAAGPGTRRPLSFPTRRNRVFVKSANAPPTLQRRCMPLLLDRTLTLRGVVARTSPTGRRCPLRTGQHRNERLQLLIHSTLSNAQPTLGRPTRRSSGCRTSARRWRANIHDSSLCSAAHDGQDSLDHPDRADEVGVHHGETSSGS